MSRSYKKTPIFKDNNHKNIYKIIANRQYRRRESEEHTYQHREYKKTYSSWIIHDYVCRWSKKDAIKQYHDMCCPEYYDYLKDREDQLKYVEKFKKEYPTVEDYLQKNWAKIYRRK